MKKCGNQMAWAGWVAAAVWMGAAWGADARQVAVDVSVSTPVLVAGSKQTAFLKIGLTGFEMSKGVDRAPVNVAIVLDKSGSMSGDKIARAREAAIMAVDRLSSADIVSIVAYDDEVSVLVPATRASDRETIRRGIAQIEAGGSTALFAGVSKGAAEVRKFLDRSRVNRVILLSDGLANVGPSSPGELGGLGASLIKEGISVTTIGLGLGYNEELMTRLARESDGNHAFAQHSEELARIFNLEFGDVLSVVAQEVVVRVDCAEGVRPVRLLGRNGDISGPRVVTALNQLYSRQEKYALLEVEVPAGEAGESRSLASVQVSYVNMETATADELARTVSVRFTGSRAEAEATLNKDVMVAATMQMAADRNEDAVRLRDTGKVAEARELLQLNVLVLEKQAQQLDSDELEKYAGENREDAANLEGEEWKTRRKVMFEEQFKKRAQQTW